MKCNVCLMEFDKTEALRIHSLSHSSKDTRTCRQCNKTFRDSYRCRRHIKSIHENLDRYSILKSHKCCLCDIEIKKPLMNEHYETQHNINIEEECFEFDSKQEFLTWKENTERSTTSKYVQHRATSKFKNGTSMTNFYCHRDGYYRTRTKNHNRRMKVIGSNKINSRCPSCMKVKEHEGRYHVTFVKTHVGHSMDAERLSITNAERDSIAQRLAMKIPMDEILDGIRGSECGEKVTPLQLIRKKDLHNIAGQYKLNKSEIRQKSYYTDVDSWVNEMRQSSNLIRFYKPQGELTKLYPNLTSEDFCLIIANDGQLSLLQRYGNEVVCVDRLTNDDFELFTILVIDDLKNGCPCAFMFSNRHDSMVIEIFFNTIKFMLPVKFDLSPKYFMSDMLESFFSGWSTVFPSSETKKLYCSWHIDKAWRQYLDEMSTNEMLKSEIFDQFKILVYETDKPTFAEKARDLLETLNSNASTSCFVSYFEGFVDDPEPWAYCFRLEEDVNIDANLENVHQRIEHIFLKGKQVRRLDKGIHAIMKFIRENMYDRFLSLEKQNVSKKLRIIWERHRSAVEAKPPLEPILNMEKTEEWSVLFKGRKGMHTVTWLNNECDCNLRCEDCAACIHNYSCTCADAAIHWNMCKHIHATCARVSVHQELANVISSPMVDDTSEPGDIVIEICIPENEIIIEELSETVTCYSLEERKTHVSNKLESILDLVDTQEKMDIVEEQMKQWDQVETLLKGMDMDEEEIPFTGVESVIE